VAPVTYRGTAFGVFNLVSGVGLLLASSLAGWLWDQQGAAAAFWAGVLLALLAAASMMTLPRNGPAGQPVSRA
jgi:MFS family permease